jgi:serine/threonine-protein kinase RsbW
MEEVELRFPANLKYLRLATSLCRELCDREHYVDGIADWIEDIELCISEACTNAIKHGSRGDIKAMISIQFHMFPDKVVIRIADQGRGFDLDSIPEPDLAAHPERGYGLYIIRSKMDEVRYFRNDMENYLEMTKYFK